MENKAGLNVNEEIQVQVKICAWLYEMSLWRPALWQSSFDLLEASISAKHFQMERKIVLLFFFFFSSKCWCKFLRRAPRSPRVSPCQVSVGWWGHGNNRSRSAPGSWFWCFTSSCAELGYDRGVASQNQDMGGLQKDCVCFVWDSCPKGNEAVWDNQEPSRCKSTHLQHLQSGFLSSPQTAPIEPFCLPWQMVWEESSHGSSLKSISWGLWRLLLLQIWRTWATFDTRWMWHSLISGLLLLLTSDSDRLFFNRGARS